MTQTNHHAHSNADFEALNALALAAQSGDAEALHELCVRYAPLVYKIANYYAGSNGDREDLAQSGFESLIRAIKHYDPGAGVYFGYFVRMRVRSGITTVARRARNVRLRAYYADAESMETGLTYWDTCADPHVVEAFDFAEWLLTLKVPMQTLSPRERLAIWMTFICGVSTTELAEAEGVSRNTAKTWLRRGQLKLAQQYGQDRDV